MDAYEDAVRGAVRIALELLAYEEVEAYLLAHAGGPEGRGLLYTPGAKDRLPARVLTRL